MFSKNSIQGNWKIDDVMSRKTTSGWTKKNEGCDSEITVFARAARMHSARYLFG
jgi:hypothetical protein